MRKIFLLLAICISSFVSAQTVTTTAPKIVIGYCNYDSLRALLPGYQQEAADVRANSELAELEKVLDQKTYEYDSLHSRWSPVIQAIKEKEISDLKDRIAKYPLENLKFNTLSYDLKLTEAINTIAKVKGYAAVLDSKSSEAFVVWSTPGTSFVNITKDICSELGIK